MSRKKLKALCDIINSYNFYEKGVTNLMIIGIAGGSGAGKTTVALTIAERIGKENVTYLSQDWYYKDSSHLSAAEHEKQNLDHPNAFDNELLISHLNLLRKGLPVEVPTYDYSSHTRGASKTMLPQSVIILEGILIFAVPELCSILDFKIFVDADSDIRLIRRLERGVNDRGTSFESNIKRYLSTVKPMHDAFVEPSKRYADIIVPRGGQNEIATELLIDLVEHFTPDKSRKI